MKIIGGVADQRVFGKYGPGPPAGILARLLEGTDSNMLLRESPAHAPEELILTPRNGGPTPPSPSASASDDQAATSGQQTNWQSVSPSQPAQAAQQSPTSQTQQNLPGLISEPGIVPRYGPGAANAAPPPTNNPQSPNGVMTPQQIYQQMQQMESQLP
jgi:hypothetical protein